MSVARNDIHPAISLSAHLLATITYATSELEARRSESRTQDLIFKLQLEEFCSEGRLRSASGKFRASKTGVLSKSTHAAYVQKAPTL
jgi:hypothetical protein